MWEKPEHYREMLRADRNVATHDLDKFFHRELTLETLGRMTLEHIAIAYAKAPTEAQRSALADILVLVSDLRDTERDFRDQWLSLRAKPQSEFLRNILSHIRAQQKAQIRVTYAMRRKDIGVDTLDVFDILEKVYEKLRSEFELVEVVQSALNCAILARETHDDQSNIAPTSLQEVQAGIRSKHDDIVLALEAFLAKHAAS